MGLLTDLRDSISRVVDRANKIDLEDSNVERIANAYPQHETVELSALEGENMDEVYAKIAKYFA